MRQGKYSLFVDNYKTKKKRQIESDNNFNISNPKDAIMLVKKVSKSINNTSVRYKAIFFSYA